jgi:hypothetical protein
VYEWQETSKIITMSKIKCKLTLWSQSSNQTRLCSNHPWRSNVHKKGRPLLQYYSKSPETQELTVIQQWKEWLAKIPGGKLPTNQKDKMKMNNKKCVEEEKYLCLDMNLSTILHAIKHHKLFSVWYPLCSSVKSERVLSELTSHTSHTPPTRIFIINIFIWHVA